MYTYVCIYIYIYIYISSPQVRQSVRKPPGVNRDRSRVWSRPWGRRTIMLVKSSQSSSVITQGRFARDFFALFSRRLVITFYGVAIIPVSVTQTLLLREPWPCDPAAEAAIKPQIWCFQSWFSNFLFRHRYGSEKSERSHVRSRRRRQKTGVWPIYVLRFWISEGLTQT